MYFCIAFCAAIILGGYQSSLFPLPVCLLLCAFALLLLACLQQRLLRPTLVVLALPLLGFCLGFAYVNCFAVWRLQQQLPAALEQHEIEVEAVISSLPVKRDRYQQFRVNVIKSPTMSGDVVLKKLLLSDYQPDVIHPCDQWQFTVRLKRSHGLGNPAGFDYEAYLLEQGVQGIGYVRQSQLLESNTGFCLHGVRQAWSDHVLSRVSRESAAWIVALSTGDNSLLNDEQSQLLQETGTTHLFVISGSHIALCALAVYALLIGLRRLGGGRFFPGDWRPLASLLALLVAAIYTALAGYGVHSLRSLVMLVVFLGARVVGLHLSLWFRYWFSMVAVLLINPLSALNTGFVLSFGAVFILILLMESVKKPQKTAGWLKYAGSHIKELFWSQWVIFIGLLPFSVLYFAQVSLLAPLVNFVAVPAMGFIILPTILLSLLLWCLQLHNDVLLHFAACQLDILFRLIEATNTFLKGIFVTFPAVAFNDTMIAVLLLACLLMLLPRVFKTLPVGLVLLMAVFLADPKRSLPENTVVVDVIDVDQGLAVLVQTAHHQMLVDTGAGWPGGSMAQRAVRPYLLRQGITRLDKVLISHLDNDHVGGIDDVIARFPVDQVYSSEPLKNVASTPCKAGQHWQWDGVGFSVLHPDDAKKYRERNNRSCVLLIEVGGRRILLPGDVEAKVETMLASGLPHIDVMVAGHHGSKTSSSPAWVQKTANGIVVFSSGYLSRFGHPHPLIEQRYRSAHVQAFNTALQGLVEIQVDASGQVIAHGWREKKGKYWQKTARLDNHP